MGSGGRPGEMDHMRGGQKVTNDEEPESERDREEKAGAVLVVGRPICSTLLISSSLLSSAQLQKKPSLLCRRSELLYSPLTFH